MNKKQRGMNNASVRSTLVKTIETITVKTDFIRWAQSPEGQVAIFVAKAEKELAEQRKEFAIGQLVWNEVVSYYEDSDDNGHIVPICLRITEVNENSVKCEMLYVLENNQKYPEFQDFFGQINKRGDTWTYAFHSLEKHVAKASHNIWWKVKQIS